MERCWFNHFFYNWVFMSIKKTLKSILDIFRPLLIVFFSIFFDRKYLTGRHFDKGFNGYRWSIRAIWTRNILRLAPPLPFPAGLNVIVSNPQNLSFHPDDINNFQSPGTYFQNFKGKIEIGRGTYIAPNVGIITANHDFNSLDGHTEGENVVIGDQSWIGMNVVLLPGVVLGKKTIVAAGAVVTKSYPDGNVVLAGIPAKPIKNL